MTSARLPGSGGFPSPHGGGLGQSRMLCRYNRPMRVAMGVSTRSFWAKLSTR
jgi:hypothetical protein